jgi:ribosome-associated translation inhibitor RaiA
LRVPKPFLGFEETAGDGKNLALQDIRFSRTINRIQQSMIQELNKIAIIHLYILGFEDDLDNFSLTLNNPSTQGEMLKVEQTQLKVTLFQAATQDLGNGFATMSMTRAHREILGWSDDEIKQDLLEQRMEKAAAAEIANTANVIKHTGMFDNVDRLYGDFDAALKGGGGAGEGAEGGEAGGGGAIGGGGGGFGGGSVGGEDLDFGDETAGEETPAEGGEAEAGATPEVGAEAGAAATETPETVAEKVNRIGELLKEEKHILGKKLERRTKKYQDIYFNRLVESMRPNEEVIDEKIKLYDKNVKINEDISNMIKGIDKILDE